MEPCKAHSGVCHAVETLERKVEEQCKQIQNAQNRIDGMKNWLIGLLVAVVLNLIGIIAVLAQVAMSNVK